MKILYVTTIGLTSIFFKKLILELIEEGHTVDFACNEDDYPVDDELKRSNCKIFQVDFSRSPISKGNIQSVKALRKIAEDNHYDIVHCHTPVAGVCTRLACRTLRKKGLKVFYTAHGFHFYKGAPLINWLIYYPVEKLMSRFTDVLITINHEDYDRACKKMKARRIELIPGVGIDYDRFAFAKVDRSAKRREIGVPDNALLLISVGELNQNKNHRVVISALALLNDPQIHYVIVGKGILHEYLNSFAAESGVAEQVHLAGYREDVHELFKAADINVFPSVREGFGLAAIEGLAAGLPLICSDNRGTREYAVDGVNAAVCIPPTPEEYKSAILRLTEHPLENVSQSVARFSYQNTCEMVKAFYNRECGA